MTARANGISAIRAGFVLVAFVGSSCGPRFERTKFEPSYRAGKAIEAAISVGVNHQKFSELTQTFATEVAIATETAKTEDEKEVASAYEAALLPVKDSLTVWALKIKHGSSVVATYEAPELGSLMEKYKVKPAYKGGETYDGESAVQIIWQDALEKLRRANDLLTKKSDA